MRVSYLFAQGDIRIIMEERKKKIVNEIQDMDRDYLLKVSEADLCDYFVDKYSLIPPEIQGDKVYVYEYGEKDVDVSYDHRRAIVDRSQPFNVKGTYVTVAVPFEGDANLLQFRPVAPTLSPPRGRIVGNEIHLVYITTSHDSESIKKLYEKDVISISSCLQNLRNDVHPYNDSLPQFVQNKVKERKEKLLAGAGLVKSLGIPIRRRHEESLTFAPPEIKRKAKIKPPKVSVGKYELEPELLEEEYDHIINVIENMIEVMERSPKAFAQMEEEFIRFHILVQLNGHYEGQATGETFNYKGKTDILIRYEGKNIFIAECKFWKGPKSLLETIDQILGYTSWRDTKTAIIILNRDRSLSTVLEKVEENVPKHRCFKRKIGKKDETQFRYVFHQPDDKNREFILTVLVFNVPSNLDEEE